MTEATQLAVWGDPIAHSRSPQLHAAAYAVLHLPWNYHRRRVSEDEFGAELAGLDARWRGLSLTMPLKAVARAAAVRVDRRAELTGAVNTLRFDPADGADRAGRSVPVGFNTDVGGMVAALAEVGVTGLERARIIGAGATASSALVALTEIGATRVEVAARRPEAAAALVELGTRIGVRVLPVPLDVSAPSPVPVTISTLPGGVSLKAGVSESLARAGGILMDVVYGQWPTALAQTWESTGAVAVSGLGMLLHQALLQVRIFVTGSAADPVDRETEVLAAMREQLMKD